MTDEEQNKSKVVPLFPAGVDRRVHSNEAERSDIGTLPDDLAVLGMQVQELLEQAEPVRQSGPAEAAGPDPAHRNAMQCPQCDCHTWRQTPFCVHCGADLVAYAQIRTRQRRQRHQAVLWSCAVVTWAIALICLEYAMHPELPPKLRRAMYLVGGAIFAVNLFGFWIASVDRRK